MNYSSYRTLDEMNEGDVSAIFNNYNLVILPDIRIGNVKSFLSVCLADMPFKFCLYGSATTLDVDKKAEINDFDIFTDMPVSVFNYLCDRLLIEFPTLFIKGMKAIYDGTYRLRVYEVTLLDITILPSALMDIFCGSNEKIAHTMGGYVIPEFFKFAESIKLLLKPGVSFSGQPHVVDSDRPKWAKKVETFRQYLDIRPPIPISKKCQMTISQSILLTNTVTYSGGIALSIYMYLTGMSKGKILSSNIPNSIILKLESAHPHAMMSYFNSTIVSETNITYANSFDGILPQCMYISRDALMIYMVKKLPPDLIFCQAKLGDLIVTLPSPIFLLFELLIFQLMPIDHKSFQRDCSYEHAYVSLVELMKKNDISSYVMPIKPARLRSTYNANTLSTVNRFNVEILEKVLSENNIHSINAVIRRKEKHLSMPEKDYARSLWAIDYN